MRNQLRKFVFAALFVGGAGLLSAEVVEEETWYNAGGEVVKKVTRTYTGADADRTPDWEPAWVVRERQVSSRTRHYSFGRATWGGSYFAPYFYGSSGYSGRYSAATRRSGLSGFYRSGSRGGSSWGVNYRSPGLSIRYQR